MVSSSSLVLAICSPPAPAQASLSICGSPEGDDDGPHASAAVAWCERVPRPALTANRTPHATPRYQNEMKRIPSFFGWELGEARAPPHPPAPAPADGNWEGRGNQTSKKGRKENARQVEMTNMPPTFLSSLSICQLSTPHHPRLSPLQRRDPPSQHYSTPLSLSSPSQLPQTNIHPSTPHLFL